MRVFDTNHNCNKFDLKSNEITSTRFWVINKFSVEKSFFSFGPLVYIN